MSVVQRYDIHMHSDDAQFLREANDGDYVKFIDFDQIQRDHDALRAQFDQHRIDTGQDAHRLISEKMAALDKYDALLEQVRAAREAIEAGALSLTDAANEDYNNWRGDKLIAHAATLRALAALVKE